MSGASSSPRTYLGIFGALVALTGLTVGVAYVDLGVFGIVAALAIAGTKAALVMVFFMHLRGSSRLLWLYAAAGFLWLFLLLSMTLGDALTREWL